MKNAAFYLTGIFAFFLCLNLQAQDFNIETISAGTDEMPKVGQEVAFHAITSQLDGTVLWSSKDLGFPMYQVIKENDSALESAMNDAFLQMGKNGTYNITLDKALFGDKMDLKEVKGKKLVITIELIDFAAPKPSGAKLLKETIENEGVEAAAVLYKDIKESTPDAYTFREGELNKLGYEFLKENKTEEALAIFRLNSYLYPSSHNVYDSLADAYLLKGDVENAIVNLKKAVAINPENTYSAEKLKELQDKE